MSVSEKEAQDARQVIAQYYSEWVDSFAEGLVEEFFLGGISDHDTLLERIDEDTDSALVYTTDQWDVLYGSSSTDRAQEELNDMGGGGDNLVGAWAVLTFRVDVHEAIGRHPLHDAIDEDLDEAERLAWLIENHGKVFYRRDRKTFAEVAWSDEPRILVIDDGNASFRYLENVLKNYPEVRVAWDAFQEGRSAEFVDEEAEEE